MPSLLRISLSNRPRALSILLCLIGIAIATQLPRLVRYLAWTRDPYLVVVSSPEEARANLERTKGGVYLPDEKDLPIWEAIYGHEKPEEFTQHYAAAIKTNAYFTALYPLNFWGLVVDQYGMPVAGAEVVFGWLNFRGGKQGWASARTGADGRVKLINAAGPHLVVSASKEGYVQSRKSGGGWYEYSSTNRNRFIPDPRQPVRLVLAKPRLSPLLYRAEKVVAMPTAGRAVGFDPELLGYNTNGPFFFSYRLGPSEGLAEGEAFLEMSVRGGGLVATQEEIPWDAPYEGYVPALTRRFPRHWDWAYPSPVTEAYFHLTNPERWGFLRIEVSELRKDSRGPETVRLEYLSSSNASRQLDHILVPMRVVTLRNDSMPEEGVVPEPPQ